MPTKPKSKPKPTREQIEQDVEKNGPKTNKQRARPQAPGKIGPKEQRENQSGGKRRNI